MKVFWASAIAATGLAVAAAAWAGDGAPGAKCKAEKFRIKQVEAACANGGLDKAKALMKDMVKTAKEQGDNINCKTCHENLTDFKLKSPDENVAAANNYLSASKKLAPTPALEDLARRL